MQMPFIASTRKNEYVISLLSFQLVIILSHLTYSYPFLVSNLFARATHKALQAGRQIFQCTFERGGIRSITQFASPSTRQANHRCRGFAASMVCYLIGTIMIANIHPIIFLALGSMGCEMTRLLKVRWAYSMVTILKQSQLEKNCEVGFYPFVAPF